MTENGIVGGWTVYGEGFYCLVSRAPYPVRIWESLQEELFEQFTVFDDGISHECLDARYSTFDVFWRGETPCLQSGPAMKPPAHSSATP